MNNNHTLIAIKDRLAEVRDSLGQAHPSIPASEIIARARRRRLRRRLIPAMTGALALAAGAAVALTVLLPASHPASRQPGLQLAAWTVVKQPGGNVSVTIRELHNPAGLQRRLRADGVPATVTSLNQLNLACHPWPQDPGAPANVIVIRPSPLPHGGGVQLAAGFSPHPPPGGASVRIGAGLVQASPQCTGS